MTRGGMLDVVLTDDDGEPGWGDRPGGSHPADGTRRRRRTPPDGDPVAGPVPVRRRGRRRGWLAVAAAAVAVAVTGWPADDGAADRAARLAAHPRVLDGAGSPVREVWTAPGGAAHTVTVGGGLVVGTFPAGRAHELVGADLATGRERWTAPLPEVSTTRDLSCVTVPAGSAPTDAGPADGAPADRADRDVALHVVCRLVTARASLADGARGFAAALLVVLDARTGERVDERPLTSRYSTLAVAGGDLLVAEWRRDGHGSVTRQDPVTGEVRWAFRTPGPLPDLADGPPVLTAQVQRDVVVVDGPAAWALTPAGAPLGEWLPRGERLAPGVRRAVDLTVLPDGRFAVTDATVEDGTGTPVGLVTARSGEDGFPLRGRVLTPVVDDGSAPGVLLTVPVGAGEVVALDAGSGRELWRGDVRPGAQTLLVDGRLVLIAGERVRALDVRTGDLLWSAPAGVAPSGPQLLTDGERVLVPVRAPGGGPRIVALGLHDGAPRWDAPAPAGVERFEIGGGRLLALRDRSTVALG